MASKGFQNPEKKKKKLIHAEQGWILKTLCKMKKWNTPDTKQQIYDSTYISS